MTALEIKWSGGSLKANSREEIVAYLKTVMEVFGIDYGELYPVRFPTEEEAEQEARDMERMERQSAEYAASHHDQLPWNGSQHQEE